MKICRITKAFFPVIDGAANHVLELSRQQSLKGHEVWILQPHKVNICDLPKGLRILRIKMPVSSNYVYKSNIIKLFFNIMAATRIVILHLSNHLDLIHAHGDFFEGLCQGIIGRLFRIPVILTIHSGMNQRQTYLLLTKYVFKIPNHFIVVSDTIKQQLMRLGLPEKKISVISSGVNIHQFQHTDYPKDEMKLALGLSKFDKVIVSVGRLEEMKGFEYLIQAIKILLKKYPKLGFVIIGDGPERDNLTVLKDKEQRIILVGEKKREDIVDYLNCSDIFALASVSLIKRAEGTPTAVMEAMAVGLPIVTTDSGGAKYIVKSGENGFIVPQRDIAALEKAIELLLEDDSLCAGMSFTNQHAAEAKDWSVISESVLKTYVDLIDRR